MSTIAKSQRWTGLGLDNFFRNTLINQLSRLKDAQIEISDPVGTKVIGLDSSDLRVKLDVFELDFYRKAVTGGSVGGAESYIQGEWNADNLTNLVRVFARNQDLLDGMEGGLARLANSLIRIPHWLRRNSIRGSRRNISEHYDVGNEFFGTFLDEHGMYSSATYLDPDDSLDRASTEKIDRICRKLELGASDSLIEIGAGWGGFACYAASRYGCAVTTTTISKEQYEAATARVNAAGLGDRVKVLMEDYRKLEGKFDKLVSIEMIEAVGHQYLETYLAKCSGLLRPTGMALIQAITIEDRRYKQSLHSVDFIKRCIFPGAFIPSVSAIVGGAGNGTDLRLINLEDQGESYALTIGAWRRKFESNLARIRQLGYSEEFIRRWRFYLAYCEGGFLERTISNAQFLFAKPKNRGNQWLAIPK